MHFAVNGQVTLVWSAFIFYSTLAPIIRNRRFLRRCQVLFGELAECKEVDDDGTIDWRVT
jgi:hypothetical protein